MRNKRLLTWNSFYEAFLKEFINWFKRTPEYFELYPIHRTVGYAWNWTYHKSGTVEQTIWGYGDAERLASDDSNSNDTGGKGV